MKSLYLSFVFMSIMTLSGCSLNATPNNTNNQLSGDQQILTGDDVQPELVDQLSGNNGDYTLFFDDKNTSKTFTLKHDARDQNIVYFINDGYSKLNVNIVLPDTQPTPNLSLTTITIPDGSIDGPFGLQTDYDLTQDGGYQLRIGESMMVGNPWTGDAQVTVSVSK